MRIIIQLLILKILLVALFAMAQTIERLIMETNTSIFKKKKGIYGERPPCATAENNSSPTPSKNPATPPTTQPPAPNNQTTPPANNNVNSASPPISPQEATSQETPPSAYQRFTGTKPAN
jgi:hypothetical protein